MRRYIINKIPPMDNLIKKLMLFMGFSFLIPLPLAASLKDQTTLKEKTTDVEIITADGVESGEETEIEPERESVFQTKGTSLGSSHFTWGGEFGMSIDLSGYDASTFNIDAQLGYKNNYFNILGVGFGVHQAIGTSDTYVPIYAVMRTSFAPRPRLFFMSLKVGYSFNTIGDSPTFGDTNAQLGAGINLAMSRKFKSYIVLAYEFRHFNQRHNYILKGKRNDISLATLSFGVNF
jgi:hypothetical protein